MSLRRGLVVSLCAVAGVVSVGCGGKTMICEGACITAGAVIDQTTPASAIVSLTADAPCTVAVVPIDGGTEVIIGVSAGTLGAPGSCQIHQTLADGTIWVAVLSWEPYGGTGCCSIAIHDVGPAPTFTRAND